MVWITPSPHELAAFQVRAPEHLHQLVVDFAAALDSTGDDAHADGLRALRAALVVAHRAADNDKTPLAPLQERKVTAYLQSGIVELIVVPVPVARLEMHTTTFTVARIGPAAAPPWRFLLDGTHLLAVDPPN